MSIKNKHLIESLDFRIDIIKKSISTLENALSVDKKEKRKQYYFDVAYFVHTINESYELKILFEELLSYSVFLKERPDFIIALDKVNSSISAIATTLLTDNDFENFENTHKDTNWFNPFNGIPILKIKDLLEKLKDLKRNSLNVEHTEIRDFFYQVGGQNGILNKWTNISSGSIEKIRLDFDELSQGIRMLAFHEKFQHDFLGVNSAIIINSFYKNMHPLFVPSEINEAFLNNSIKSGDDNSEANNLLLNCEKIRTFLVQKLNTKHSITVSIQRFQHYMEVFYNGSLTANSERKLQSEFESFMFTNGYFALSEGNLGNGRFDNIILNQENAFLCEHKQIGFGKTKTTKHDSIKKFASAKIQAEIYHRRLKSFPDLSSNIYILIFSKFSISFMNGIHEVQKDGLNFIFNLICLNKDKPSIASKSESIDLEALFKD